MYRYYRPVSKTAATILTAQMLSFCIFNWLVISRKVEPSWADQIVAKCGSDYLDRSTDNA